MRPGKLPIALVRLYFIVGAAVASVTGVYGGGSAAAAEAPSVGRARADQTAFRKDTQRSLGMGLAEVSDWSSEYPFLDFAKQARAWIPQKEGRGWGKGDALELDESGWVRALKAGQRADLIFVTTSKGDLPYDRFVVRYKGKGVVGYRLAARKLTEQSRLNRDVIAISDSNDGYAVLSIEQTDPQDPIREISIVPLKHASAHEQGRIFNPDWIQRLAPFRAVRFMDWTKTNNSVQQRWGDRPRLGDYSWAVRGVPWEVTIALANELGTDAWINIPHLADREYVRELARLFKAKLAPNLKIYVEHSNEVWNWQFGQAHHANATGRARWGDVGDAFMQWHGMRTAEVCDVWKREVFGDESGRVNCVLGAQAGWRGLEQAALECPKWVAEGNEPCYRHGIDSLAIAGYFGGCLNRADPVRKWFGDSDKGLGRAFRQLVDGSQFECPTSIKGMAATYAYFHEVAKSRGLALVAYEGGQHVTGNGSKVQDEEDFIAFHMAINRDPRMGAAYTKNLEAWKNAGGTLFVHYHDISRPSKWGSWGALESLGQASSPKWKALTDFSLTERCWWANCDRADAHR